MEYLLTFLVGVLVGWFILKLIFKGMYETAIEREGTIKGRIVNHIKPRYYGYSGGFDDITKCSKCNLTGLYEDLHPASPCPKCGGEVEEIGAGKWVEIDGISQWVESEHNR
jgi:hypothetical protein